MLTQAALILLIVSSVTPSNDTASNSANSHVANGRRFFGTMTKGFQKYKVLGRGYKLITDPITWHDAKDKCMEEGGNLAMPRSLDEFTVMQGTVRQMKGKGGVTRLVWLGISNLENYKVWTNLEDKDIKEAGFHVWAGNNGQTISDNRVEPHCAGMDGHNVGLREWWCERLQPALCEVQLDEQGRDVPWAAGLGNVDHF